MASRTTTVNMSGNRLRRFSVHSALNSSLWFFFTTMARRKGEMSEIVTSPHTRLPQNRGNSLLTKGRKKVSITAMTAAERME